MTSLVVSLGHETQFRYLELNPPSLSCLNIPDIIRHAGKQRLTLDSIEADSLHDFLNPKQPSDDEQAQRRKRYVMRLHEAGPVHHSPTALIMACT